MNTSIEIKKQTNNGYKIRQAYTLVSQSLMCIIFNIYPSWL